MTLEFILEISFTIYYTKGKTLTLKNIRTISVCAIGKGFTVYCETLHKQIFEYEQHNNV